MHQSPKPNLLDESQWVIRIRNILEEEWEGDDNVVVSSSIAGVPKPLLSTKHEAYIPQLIALGPYHHDREELREMERYKLSAAKRIRTRSLPNIKFRHLVDLFVKVEYRIRAHYQRYLPLNGETLAWMMAIDASFLLEFLQAYSTVAEPDVELLRIPAKVARMAASSDQRTSTHDMLLRDIVMLENQIPVFLLYKVLEVQFSAPDVAEEALTLMLVGLLKDLTPFKMIRTDFQSIDMKQNSHLLELLYHSIVPYSSDVEEEVEVEANLDDSTKEEESGGHRTKKCRFIAAAARVVIVARTKAFLSVLFKLLIKIPCYVITSIPTFAMFKHLIIENTTTTIQMDHPDSSSSQLAGLQFEEIAIPSITELAYAGIRFEATNGDLTSVAFDAKTATLHLPKISLDVNTEVVVRNLVAYETAIKAGGPLTFTRYVELMNGIIDSDEDARVLRKRGVVVNGLRSDAEVAELWNGMSPSVRLTRVRFLDEVIEGVNSYYNGRWKVRAGRFVNLTSCRHSSLVLLVLLLFMAFPAFLNHMWREG